MSQLWSIKSTSRKDQNRINDILRYFILPFRQYRPALDGVQFRWYLQDLGHPWTDWDETLGVYRVDPDIMQRHIFDFRFRPQTGNRLFFENRKFQKSKPEVENMLDEKRIQFCSASHILVF